MIDLQHTVNACVARHVGAAHPGGVLALVIGFAARLGGALRHRSGHVVQQHIAGQGGLARARHARDGHQALERNVHTHLAQVVQGRAFQAQKRQCLGIHGSSRLQRVAHRMQQIAPSLRVGLVGDVFHRTFGHQTPAPFARAWTNVDDVVGTTDGVFVMFHHHQGVALVAEHVQRVQQNLVVAGMQANGGFVQHVAHALQVAAQLRGQSDALRFAATQGGGPTVEREVAQAHLLQKLQAAFDLGQQVARNLSVASVQAHCFGPATHVGHAQTGDLGDAHPGKLHRTCGGVQARAFAGGAGGVDQVVHIGLGKGLLAAFVFVVAHRVVQHLALVFVELDPRAHAVGAPAVLAVVGEQARIQLGIRGVAHRAGAFGGVRVQAANAVGLGATQHGFAQAVQLAQHVHHAFAMLQRRGQSLAQGRFVLSRHHQACHGQFNGVLFEAVNARKACGRQEVPVHPQVGVATRAGPVGQFGVDAFAVHHQGTEQADVLAFELTHQLRRNAVRRLRLHRRAIMRAMLGAEFDKQQAQKVPHLGGCAHGGFAPAA